MPPKKQPNQKELQKKKEKIIEDKTFGMKNKKGNKQQKYIKTVTQQINFDKKKKDVTATQKSKQEKQQELLQYFNPVVELPNADDGVDPKTILCPYFKQGVCTKGNKCKYSHNLQEGKHKSVYIDQRVSHEDTHRTEIICKYFLEAVESDLFGWRWTCPNGESCQYRHCLPQGYVLKRDEKLMREKEEAMTIEEYIETGRAKLEGDLTLVTAETFARWKRERLRAGTLAVSEGKKRGKGCEVTGREILEGCGEEGSLGDDQVINFRVENEEAEDFMEVDESLFLMEGSLDEELACLTID